MKTVELRCLNPECRCSKKGKLLAKFTLPIALINMGGIIELVCPKNKKKKLRFPI